MLNKFFIVTLSINFLYCNIEKSFNIYAFGDSHILFSLHPQLDFSKNTSFAESILYHNNEKITFSMNLQWLGAKTLHGAPKCNFLHFFSSIPLASIDGIIFSFGEIDIRCHIEKQSLKQHKSFEEITDTLVNNFFTMLNVLKQTFPDYKGIFIFLAVIPPVQKPISNNPDYPFYGNVETRLHINKILNATLEKYSKDNNVIFFDPYTYFTDEKGLLKNEYSDQAVHFNPHLNSLIIKSLYEKVFLPIH